MTTSAIIINLVLSIVVTAFVGGTAFFVPFLLDRRSTAATRQALNVAGLRSRRATETRERVAAA